MALALGASVPLHAQGAGAGTQDGGTQDGGTQDGGTQEGSGSEAEDLTPGPEVRLALREAHALWSAAVSRRSEPAQIHAIERLSAIDVPQSIEFLLVLGVAHTTDPLAAAIRRALTCMRQPGSLEYLGEQLLRSRSTPRSLLIIEALQAIPGPHCVEPLLAVLRHSTTTVLHVESLRALRWKPARNAVEGLIEYYSHIAVDGGLVWDEARIALFQLTGESYLEPGDWRAWWEVRRDSWVPTQISEDARHTSVVRPDLGDLLQLPTLFGKEIASRRVVFVLDTSESMSKVDEHPRASEEGSSRRPETRLQRAQRELLQVLYELPAAARFNIVAYSSYPRIWKRDQLSVASDANKQAARGFVESLSADGYTNTREALLLALSLPDVDTIVFVSDGSPTLRGRVEPAAVAQIHREVNQANRFRKVTIHSMGFPGALVPFMRKIAQDNGGNYQHIR